MSGTIRALHAYRQISYLQRSVYLCFCFMRWSRPGDYRGTSSSCLMDVTALQSLHDVALPSDKERTPKFGICRGNRSLEPFRPLGHLSLMNLIRSTSKTHWWHVLLTSFTSYLLTIASHLPIHRSIFVISNFLDKN